MTHARPFVIAFATALLFNCGSLATAQQVDMVGKWVGQVKFDEAKLSTAIDALLESQIPAGLAEAEKAQVKALLDAQKPMILEKIVGELGKTVVTIDVSGDGTYKASTDKGEAKKETSGTWKVEKKAEGELLLTTHETGKETPETAKLTVKDAKTLLMEMPEEDAKQLPASMREAFLGMELKKQ
jgi:hypothetical protein